jgi:ABC-type multidrug transport system fused ATPase/permease subunit
MNIFTVQSFSQEQTETRKYQKMQKKFRNHCVQLWNYYYAKDGAIKDILTDLGLVGVISFGVYLAYHEVITVGTLVFAVTLTLRAFGAMRDLTYNYNQFKEYEVGVARVLDLLEVESNIVEVAQPKTVGDFTESITFEKVGFHYDDRKQKTLANLNFSIQRGQKVALVGPSGGGKSTIIKLLYRHYDPTSGNLKLDGTDIRDFAVSDYRSLLAIVPQDVEVFNGTIKDNIAYGVKRATQQEIVAAAKIAHVHDFVQDFSKKYQTEVGERGVKLSGGQRQRIGIARAILANPEILIFDEATSNLDSHSERLIQDAIEKISHDRTMIIIAHRLSTIRNCDQILVIENGRLKQAGSHAELTKQKGVYRHLLELQELGEL